MHHTPSTRAVRAVNALTRLSLAVGINHRTSSTANGASIGAAATASRLWHYLCDELRLQNTQ